LGNLAVDLLLCQEVFHNEHTETSQSANLARVLGLNSYYGANKFRNIGHHGNTTFTRLSVEFFENHDISTNRIERRGALYVRSRFNGLPLHIFNVHLGLSQNQRQQQIHQVQQIIEHQCPNGDPIILAGDFNDWSKRLNPMITEKLGFHNAFADIRAQAIRTWPAGLPVFGLDRIYLKNLNAVEVKRLDGKPWSELSDHLPLWAKLDIHN